MKFRLLFLLLILSGRFVSATEPADATAGVGRATQGWHYEDIRRVSAAEARQGVAVDDEFFYVISNHAIGKYRKDTGARISGWECEAGAPLTHLNAGVVREGRLYCAHSNYPGVPNLSSVEIWDVATMRHVGSHSFGRADGSLTWLDRHDRKWIACFVHYRGKGGEPGRGPEWTHLVEFDDDWRQTGGWAFPGDLMAKLGANGYSVSGGAFGPGGFLYVTGHDDTALYVLAMPGAGPTLEWVTTIPITAKGQAFGWDPRDSGVIYTLSKAGREVLIGRVTGGSTATPTNPTP